MTERQDNTKSLRLGTEPDLAPLRVALRAITRSCPKPSGAGMPESRKPLTYAESGVDIDVGNRIVDRIRPFARRTRRPGRAPSLADLAGCSI